MEIEPKTTEDIALGLKSISREEIWDYYKNLSFSAWMRLPLERLQKQYQADGEALYDWLHADVKQGKSS